MKNPQTQVCISETCLRHAAIPEDHEECKTCDDDVSACTFGCVQCALMGTLCVRCERGRVMVSDSDSDSDTDSDVVFSDSDSDDDKRKLIMKPMVISIEDKNK